MRRTVVPDSSEIVWRHTAVRGSRSETTRRSPSSRIVNMPGEE
ncbi:MAG: hypothetical protein ACLT1W_16060 [Alistipes onderdonkii]